jgi:hypothetical protein
MIGARVSGFDVARAALDHVERRGDDDQELRPLGPAGGTCALLIQKPR